MIGKLNRAQINYVIEHLRHHISFEDELLSDILYGEEPEPGSRYIFIPSASNEYDPQKTIWICDVPVLYPMSESLDEFYTFNDGNLVFHHDLLKSAFHLLSGYQEYKLGTLDEFGRFPYSDSLQYKLNIISKPVVNYYFNIILTAIRKYCSLHRIEYSLINRFPPFAFFLSHDIDHIDAYHFYETGYKFKQALGLVKSPYSKRMTLKLAFISLYHFFNPFSEKNPFWNFSFLRNLEKRKGIRSTFYFLEKDGLHTNSRYRFSEKRIKQLIRFLEKESCEIGLHGTIQSSTSLTALEKTLDNLQSVTNRPIRGIRQHYLKCAVPDTMILHEKAGLKYDSSLGFAAHEGFRNSYCHPFRLFDFENNRTIDLWEIPLLVMDGTISFYRKLSFNEAKNSMEDLLREVEKFNGIFSLLWHNSHFDEHQFPGITRFYEDLLAQMMYKKPESLTGIDIIGRMPG